MLSYGEKYHYETDKQSGIVIGPFYLQQYLLFVHTGIVSSSSVSPFFDAYNDIEVSALILNSYCQGVALLKA